MSLLLDALKKAAEDKEKLTAIDSTVGNDADISANRKSLEEKKVSHKRQPTEPELQLVDRNKSNEVKSHNKGSYQIDDFSPSSIDEQVLISAKVNNGSRLSADALHLLVDKTNQGFKKKKVTLLILVLMLSVLILVTGGLYYLQLMQRNITEMENRHNAGLHRMREKTSKEELPNKRELIKNIAEARPLQKKVAFARKVLAKTRSTEKNIIHQPSVKHRKRSVPSLHNKTGSDKKIKFQRTRVVDQTGNMLDKAWLDYQHGDFEKASMLYRKVLLIEKNNRDALLGMAAIARQNKSFEKARQYYSQLLSLNPDDPDAIAALTSMQSPEQAATSIHQLKELLRHNPASASLNFALGNVYATHNRWKAAQAAYFNAWVNNRESAVYAFNLAVSLDQLTKFSQASKFYKKSLSLSDSTTTDFSRQSVLKRLRQITLLEK